MAEGTVTSDMSTDTTEPAVESIARGLATYVRAVHEPSLLARLRRDGWKTFVETPMPTRKSEEWRYTDLSSFDPESYSPVTCDGERVPVDQLPVPVRKAMESDRDRSGVMVRHNGCLEHLRLDPGLRCIRAHVAGHRSFGQRQFSLLR